MKPMLSISAGALVIGLATWGCGSADEPRERSGLSGADEMVELHHNSPVYEQVDDLVSENHNEAIADMLERMADVDQTVNQSGDIATSSDVGDAATTLTQSGDSPGYDGDDFLTQPNDNAEDSFDSVDQMLEQNVPTETQDGAVSGDTTSTRTGEASSP